MPIKYLLGTLSEDACASVHIHFLLALFFLFSPSFFSLSPRSRNLLLKSQVGHSGRDSRSLLWKNSCFSSPGCLPDSCSLDWVEWPEATCLWLLLASSAAPALLSFTSVHCCVCNLAQNSPPKTPLTAPWLLSWALPPCLVQTAPWEDGIHVQDSAKQRN